MGCCKERMLREKDVTLFLSPQASRGALASVGALFGVSLQGGNGILATDEALAPIVDLDKLLSIVMAPLHDRSYVCAPRHPTI